MITKRDDILSAIKAYMSQINLRQVIKVICENNARPDLFKVA